MKANGVFSSIFITRLAMSWTRSSVVSLSLLNTRLKLVRKCYNDVEQHGNVVANAVMLANEVALCY